MGHKSPDILLGPGEVFVFVRARATGKQIRKVPDTRIGSDELIVSDLAVVLIFYRNSLSVSRNYTKSPTL